MRSRQDSSKCSDEINTQNRGVDEGHLAIYLITGSWS